MACVMFCFILSYSLWFLFLLLILSWKNNVQIKQIFIFFLEVNCSVIGKFIYLAEKIIIILLGHFYQACIVMYIV
jgi:hypothetical protein